MKTLNITTFGWRYNQVQKRAVVRKKSQVDFLLSVIIAFLIIFVISQLLSQFDQLISQPVIQKNISLLNPLHINTASAASLEAIKMVESQKDIVMVKGATIKYTVGFKNLGSKTWEKTGTGKVDLRRKDKYSLALKTTLATNDNKTGQIGYFNCTLTAPDKVGTYKYKFLLARNGKEVIKGSEYELVIIVKDKVTAPKVASNTNTQPVNPVNTNITTSSNCPKNDPSKPVGLAEICLSLGCKSFKAATIDKKLIDECLKIGIKVTDEGVSYIKLEPTPQSATYPAPSPAPAPTPPPAPTPNPTPAPTPSPAPVNYANGPLVRIGLFYTTDPIVITANTSYVIKDQNGSILSTIPAYVQTIIVFNFSNHTYTFKSNGASLATSSYLRLEGAGQDTVMEIVSLNWRPAWNTSLNDNKFLGSLEVRYSSNTGRLWTINELAMENYLKGLAETSNDSPIEYQKALITAARTYAMYHYNRGTKHAAEYFTLDATYDQVYKGYNSQLRLPNVSLAVEQTKGQVVTYNGQVVVTPYFSYSDGHTRNWEDVWGGSPVAWCRSVKEPADYDKTTMYGHGVGLSAHGALHLAVYSNYTFDQILKYYYTGVELKKIY